MVGGGVYGAADQWKDRSCPEVVERADFAPLFLWGDEGRGGVRARDEGVGERNAAVENRTVTRDGPGDDVSAVVRARAGVLAEI